MQEGFHLLLKTGKIVIYWVVEANPQRYLFASYFK
jgi:hypothetical protein